MSLACMDFFSFFFFVHVYFANNETRGGKHDNVLFPISASVVGSILFSGQVTASFMRCHIIKEH